MSVGRHAGDVLNINVGGKRYTVCRNDMMAIPSSKLAEMFRPGNPMPTDKTGGIFLNRDGKAFRHILVYLRLKRSGFGPATLALPSKPDDLAKLVLESDALNLCELKELALEMLERYRRSDEHFSNSFVQLLVREVENWKFEKQAQIRKKSRANQQCSKSDYYDDD